MDKRPGYNVPVIAFSAYSGTGKTTLIEKLIYTLKSKGLRVGVIKHDAHAFEIDREGKDSWRFTHAGADITILSSEKKTAVIETRHRGFCDILAEMHDVDIVLVEGYQDEELPRIGISRKAAGKGLRGDPGQFIAIVSDDEVDCGSTPLYSLDDIGGITEFILRYCKIM